MNRPNKLTVSMIINCKYDRLFTGFNGRSE
jgi:hypothetical protein